MEHELPVSLSRELELLGVISNELPADLPEETFAERNFNFRMPNFDENGEPDF